MDPVIRLVSQRFRRMRLKDKVKTFPAASGEDIEEIMSLLSLIDEEITVNDAVKMTSKDVARNERLTSFLEKHTKQTLHISGGVHIRKLQLLCIESPTSATTSL